MNRPVHALALGLVLTLFSSTGFALGLEQRGQPEPQLITMPTYGMEVPARTALKSVVPAGWQLFIHQSAKLPDTMSWKLGDAWSKVLADLANSNKLSVLIDWEAKTVLLRTDEVAVQERATRAEITQAAVTPLPAFEGAVSAKQEERLAAKRAVTLAKVAAATPTPSPTAATVSTPQTVRDSSPAQQLATEEASRQRELDGQMLAQAASMRALPVIRTNPTPQMVTAQEIAATKSPPKLASTPDFAYTQPVALNKPAARKVAQAIANKYKLRLVWAAPEFNLQGPVTLLAQSAQDDVRLLQKAVGVFSPVIFEVSENEKVLRVLPRELASTRNAPVVLAQVALAASVPPQVAPEAVLLEPVMVSGSQPRATAATTAAVSASATASSTAQASAHAEVRKLTLRLNDKEPLEDALLRFVRTEGYTLEWKVPGGYEANRAMYFEGDSLVQVLSQLLPPLGVSADVYTKDKHIVVRPGEGRDR